MFLYSYITTTYKSDLWAGLSSVLFGVGQLAMTIAMSFINGKIDANKYLVHLVAVGLMGCCASIMGLIDNVYVMVSIYCVYGGMYGVVLSNIANIVKHLNGKRSHSLVYAISQTSGGIGALAAPPLLAKLQQILPLSSLFYFSAGFSFASFFLMFLMLVIKRSLWHPTKDFYTNTTSDQAQDVNQEHKMSNIGVSTIF